MDLLKSCNKNILFACFITWVFLYGCCIVAIEVTSIYVAIFLIIAPILSSLTLSYFSISQPNANIVNEILGYNPRLLKDNDITLSNGLNKSLTKDSKLKQDKIFKVYGHRGAALDAPENSITAFRKCHERGCMSVEFDLSLTADDVPIVFHDDSIDRLTIKTGYIQKLTWEELKTLDITVKHPLKERFSFERIALFEEVIDLCMELDMRVVIDIKADQYKIVKVLLAAYKKYPQMYERAIVSSFHPYIIYCVRQQDPKIVCSLAWRPYFYSCSSIDPVLVPRNNSLPKYYLTRCLDVLSTWFFQNFVYHLLGISAVLLHKNCITPEIVSQWEQKNIRVIVWTVNRPYEKQYFSKVLSLAYMTDCLIGDP